MTVRMVVGARLAMSLVLIMVLSPVGSASPPQWTYSNQVDAEGWAGLVGEGAPPPNNYPYAVCSIGKQQSPIPLLTQAPKTPLNALRILWPPFEADFFNDGHVLEVLPVEPSLYRGALFIGRDIYPFVQAHLHSPSEHTLDGQTYDAELHFVHVRANGMAALLTVFMVLGKPNLGLQTILDHAPNTPGIPTHRTTTIRFDLKGLLPKGAISTQGIVATPYLSYQGSLSEPPCSEGVAWYVLEKPTTLSKEQLVQLEQFFKNNRRTLQPVNGRETFSNFR